MKIMMMTVIVGLVIVDSNQEEKRITVSSDGARIVATLCCLPNAFIPINTI